MKCCLPILLGYMDKGLCFQHMFWGRHLNIVSMVCMGTSVLQNSFEEVGMDKCNELSSHTALLSCPVFFTLMVKSFHNSHHPGTTFISCVSGIKKEWTVLAKTILQISINSSFLPRTLLQRDVTKLPSGQASSSPHWFWVVCSDLYVANSGRDPAQFQSGSEETLSLGHSTSCRTLPLANQLPFHERSKTSW